MAKHKIEMGVGGHLVPPIENLTKNAKRSEEQGFHSLWWPDHLMAWDPDALWTPDITPLAQIQRSPHVQLDPIVAIAAAGLATSTIRLGTAVVEPLRRHPAMLAQEFLTLDHLSKGRVILGLGAGEGENTIPYGIDFSYAVSKMEEALQVIRLLWSTDEPVDFEGRFFRLEKAVLGLRPYGEKPPPIWLASMGPRMLAICARYGDGWLPTLLPPKEYGEKRHKIMELAKEYGRDPESFEWSMSACVVVDDDHEACHQVIDNPLIKNQALLAPPELYRKYGAEHPLGADFYGLRDYIPNRYGREELLDAIRRIPAGVAQESFLHGTPDELCALLEEYAENGLQSIVLFNITFMPDLSRMRSSYSNLLRLVEHFR